MQNTSLGRILHIEGLHLQNISTCLAGLPPREFNEQVKPLREYFKQFDEDGELSKLMLETNVKNYLVDGLYVRELTLVQGSLVLSRVHKRPLINIISKGTVTVIDSNGETTYTAPSTFISPAGTQRVVFASEETVWNTAHLTTVTNPDDLVDDLTFDNYEDFISYSHQLKHQE